MKAVRGFYKACCTTIEENDEISIATNNFANCTPVIKMTQHFGVENPVSCKRNNHLHVSSSQAALMDNNLFTVLFTVKEGGLKLLNKIHKPEFICNACGV